MARSAVHHRYAALGATFERAHGWDLPVRFPYDDRARVESADVVLADESAVGKFHLEGADVKPAGGGFPSARYAIRPGASLVIVPLAHRAAAAARFAAPGSGCAHAVDVSAAWGSFVLAGPDAPEALASLCTTDLSRLAEGTGAGCSVGGHIAVVGRHRRGWRLLVGRDEAEDVWGLIEGFEPDLVVASWETAREWLW